VKARPWNEPRPQGMVAQMADAHRRGAISADQAVADARSIAIHQYRDQERTAQQDVARILADEGWAHRWYRTLRRQPVPPLTTPARAKPVIDAWAKQSSESSDERPVWPDDARNRTLEEAIASIRPLGP
ncbi:MAG: hypothetical protein LC777_11170, partial [Actinobacteria bacterium]|nr:hypothetical protein [Actinomycetota bacterium]